MKFMANATSTRSLTQSQGLWLGVLFSALFTGLIWLAGSRLDSFPLRPDIEIPFWYPWVSAEPTVWTRISVWGGYTLHQVTVWGLIYYAQRNNTKYSNKLHAVNVWALLANAAFIGFHFVQTHIWYDGLALDVSEQSSQWSVILLLVIVLLMENQRRGLFFGKKIKGSVMKESGRVLRKYHGYYFAWATIYTFWYHPMVSTPGHLIGFFYMFLLLLQGSLFFTRIHTNKWWMVTQEVSVLFHGTLVAFSNAPDLWQMFCFGFAGLFVVTQMYGLGLPKWARWGFLAAYIGGVIAVFSDIGFENIHQITWIPITEYAVVFIIAIVVWGVMKLISLVRPTPTVA